jgi:hypothetical protein
MLLSTDSIMKIAGLSDEFSINSTRWDIYQFLFHVYPELDVLVCFLLKVFTHIVNSQHEHVYPELDVLVLFLLKVFTHIVNSQHELPLDL